MLETPEHEKLKKVSDKSQVIGEFIEWLETEGFYVTGRKRGKYFNLRWMLAKFFNIDEQKLEAEKIAMLEEMRQL